MVPKMRVTYLDEVSRGDLFLRPDDQLLANQGTRMFGYVNQTHKDQRPDCAKSVVLAPTQTVRSLKSRYDDYLSSMTMPDPEESAATSSARDGEDLLLSGSGPSPDVPEPLRSAGLDISHLETEPPAKKRRVKASKKAEKGAPEAPAEAAPEGEGAGAADELASQTTQGKKSLANLDEGMKTVAEKHLASDGSSVKSLEGLTPEAFLSTSKEDDLRVLAGQLRGVRHPEFLRKSPA